MKDSGCQLNFILESALNHNKFKIINDNYSLTINGFNSSKEYVTKIVELNLGVGDKTYKIKAICVPNMPINIELPKLGLIVTKFKEKGFELADKLLNEKSNRISNISFIMGTDASYVIPEKTIVFGIEEPSCYLDTPIGIMLVGSSKNLLNNKDFLKSNSKLENITNDKNLMYPRLISEKSERLYYDEENAKFKDTYSKLKKVRENLIEKYNNEFLTTLTEQATKKTDRYKRKHHQRLKVGDIVLLKEKYLKSYEYPLGVVKSLQTNVNNEVTGAIIKKGKTKENVKRHVNSLIHLQSVDDHSSQVDWQFPDEKEVSTRKNKNKGLNDRQDRMAAIRGKQKVSNILAGDYL